MGMGLRLCNYLINTCTLKTLLGQCFPKGQFYFFRIFSTRNFGFVISQVQTNPWFFHHKIALWVQCCYFKLLSLHVFTCRKATFYLYQTFYIITVLSNKVHCMIGTIHLAEFAPPSGLLQPGGYQIPHPQHLYSRVGGHQPSSAPSQLQQGMTKCVPALLCC